MLENSYLCGSNNNITFCNCPKPSVVICLKIPTFVVATTTNAGSSTTTSSCDLLENSYLCGSNNNYAERNPISKMVVICLKIPTFVVATTTEFVKQYAAILL